jgi:hypothetical protein
LNHIPSKVRLSGMRLLPGDTLISFDIGQSSAPAGESRALVFAIYNLKMDLNTRVDPPPLK